MSWRTRFKAKGSFRGVEFVCPSDDMSFGRRIQSHEYPQREIGWAEDLGKKAREYSLSLFVVGDNYDKDRDKLIEAFEVPGPGTLVHPRFGKMQVVVDQVRKTESTREGGMCRFDVTFIDAGKATFPSASADTAGVVDDAADKTLADSINDFADNFSVLGQAADYVDGVVDEVANTFAAVENLIGSVTGPIADAIRTPGDMAAIITGSMSRISTAIEEPERALNGLKALFDAGKNSPSTPSTTSNRQQQAANIEQMHNLTRRAAIAEAARLTSTVSFTSSDDALRWRDNINTAIDEQLDFVSAVSGLSIDDNVYQSLVALRAAVTNDLNVRGAKLPQVVDHTPQVVEPALVLAHRLYGDADRAGEIIDRNNIPHPLFVPAGELLEVLSD